MSAEDFPQGPQIVPSLYIINQLLLRASAATSTESLKFIIVNDTVHLLAYDRAYLFDLEQKHPALISISGLAEVNDSVPIIRQLETFVSTLKLRDKITSINESSLNPEEKKLFQELQTENKSSYFWLPIFYDQTVVLGLLLERWKSDQFTLPVEGLEKILKKSLLPAYGIAWNRLERKVSIKKWFYLNKWRRYLALGLLLGALFLIQIPLRVVAPCEVVARDPFLIRAPLEGVVKEVVVKPGEMVNKNDLLLEYEPQTWQELLKSSQMGFLEKKLDVERAAVLGLTDDQLLQELSVLKTREKKEQAALDYAKYQFDQIRVKAPAKGVVVIDSPDQWKGRPVKVGEKIMTISDPQNTKIKIWIPESDNVPFDPTKTVKVFLNVSSMTSYPAIIEYIANEVTMSDQQIPSFVADARWDGSPPAGVKIGLKGSAVLYGESVSLFNYIFRRPWFWLRNTFGF